MWGVGIDPPQLGTRSMENLISLLANNPDAPVAIVLLLWTAYQVTKIKAKIAAMQNDIDHLTRAITSIKQDIYEGRNNRHQD